MEVELGLFAYCYGTYYWDDWEDRCSHTGLFEGDQVIDITRDMFRNNKKPLKYEVPVYVDP